MMVAATDRSRVSRNEVRIAGDRVVVVTLWRVHAGVRLRLDHVRQRRREATEGREGSLASRGRPGERDHAQDDQLPVMLRGNERHGRAGHDVGDGRQLLGRRIGGRDEPRDGCWRGGQDEHAAGELGQVVQSQLEAGRHSEVAAATPDGPEQVGMAIGIDSQELAIGGDDVRGQQVVDRQAVLAHQVADAATKGDAADAHRGRVAEAGDELVFDDRGRVRARGQPRLDPRRVTCDVELQGAHVPQVQHDAVIDDTHATIAVAAAPDGQRQASGSGQRDDRLHVGVVGDLDDDPWAPVDATHEHGARMIVVGVVGRDHPAPDRAAERTQVDGTGGGGAGLHQALLSGRFSQARS